jgi:Zn-dependent protease with chaperone function
MSVASYGKCACGACGVPIEFPVEAAGMVVDCPGCRQPTTLTLPATDIPTTGADPGPLTLEEVLGAFEGEIRRTPVSILYQIGLVVVAITMVVLPLIYLALIGAAGWGVYHWATHFTFLLGGGGHWRLQVLKFLGYAGPLVVGGILVIFMIKPLFARRPPQAQPLALSEDAAPVLVALVHRICELVGAPKPRRIDVDCRLNASASFRRGLWSLFGNDLVLTIGLPLVAGMNTRQLAGVIAHEFGHFTQGFGMRLTYLIRTINAWFFRVVYERDSLDLSLDEWAEEGEEWWILLIANLARVAVWGSRQVLKLLMLIGHLIGCFMLRQMEYDADSYEIKVAGSRDFESTMRRLHVLGEILGRTYKGVRVGFNLNQELPDDFSARLMREDEAFPAHERAKLEDTMGLEPTGLFDTHASNGDRIRRARQADLPGVFHLEVPATRLFSDFAATSKVVTMSHYQDDQGIPLEMIKLKPVAAPPSATAETEPSSAAPSPAEAALANSPIKLKNRWQG